MSNSEPQEVRMGSGKEIALLVGVLLLVAAGDGGHVLGALSERRGFGAAGRRTGADTGGR